MSLFQRIKKELSQSLRSRDQVVRISRGILQDSKKAIFLCHEGHVDLANKNLKTTYKLVRQTESMYMKKYSLYRDGAWAAAAEEFLEAWFFCNFLLFNKISEPKNLKVPAEVYVGALADFTGEVVRQAVLVASQRDSKRLEKYKKVVAQVIGSLLPLYLSGQNRQKADQAKRNLKRLEEIIYEVKIRN